MTIRIPFVIKQIPNEVLAEQPMLAVRLFTGHVDGEYVIRNIDLYKEVYRGEINIKHQAWYGAKCDFVMQQISSLGFPEYQGRSFSMGDVIQLIEDGHEADHYVLTSMEWDVVPTGFDEEEDEDPIRKLLRETDDVLANLMYLNMKGGDE